MYAKYGKFGKDTNTNKSDGYWSRLCYYCILDIY